MVNETMLQQINQTLIASNQEITTQVILISIYFITLVLSNLGFMKNVEVSLSLATLTISLILLFNEFNFMISIVLIGVSFINLFK